MPTDTGLLRLCLRKPRLFDPVHHEAILKSTLEERVNRTMKAPLGLRLPDDAFSLSCKGREIRRDLHATTDDVPSRFLLGDLGEALDAR